MSYTTSTYGRHHHICGFYYVVREGNQNPWDTPSRHYLPQVQLSAHTNIVASTSRTTLTQTFINPQSDKPVPELRYIFPLYDGVSVVGFTCTINKDCVIRGLVKERNEARKTFDDAVARGETAGILEQLPEASDVFTTTVGNVPSGAEIKVDITYLGELKHDAEVDGIRFTLPTSISPRYGHYPGQLAIGSNVSANRGITIVVDAEVPVGSNISSIQSPSHPISVTIGNTSYGTASGAEASLRKASATLSLGTAELDKDFVLHVVAPDTGNPSAVLETHPQLPNHRAVMATLVPKFNLPSSRSEIVFVCDRSGSMGTGQRIPRLKAALQIFLKSLPLGVKFNICSFGNRHHLLFDNGSVSYDASSVEKATKYVDGFAADFGGTDIFRPLEAVIKNRHSDMDLEIFLLTDGDVWNQGSLIDLVNKSLEESKGTIRLFTLGIGDAVSHALVEGLARAGNGFSQTVLDNEKMNSKVLRMLKAALTPHINDYTLEIKYEAASDADDGDSDFELVEKVMVALAIGVLDPGTADGTEATTGMSAKPISLFDPNVDPDVEMEDASKDTATGARYMGVPPVTEPKLLQAPFVIPALYPFNRTSVYLLLSAETTKQNPKSIVLRGTSACGPLELEIPVTVLPEKGETIHQLAARKAIRELEDGRGWIFQAKDKSDGRLLKDKFPGRFSDMVEREAVRLGVTFQVGGKWCSFVAVDGQHENRAHEQGRVAFTANDASRPSPYRSTNLWSSASYERNDGNASVLGSVGTDTRASDRDRQYRRHRDRNQVYTTSTLGMRPLAPVGGGSLMAMPLSMSENPAVMSAGRVPSGLGSLASSTAERFSVSARQGSQREGTASSIMGAFAGSDDRRGLSQLEPRTRRARQARASSDSSEDGRGPGSRSFVQELNNMEPASMHTHAPTDKAAPTDPLVVAVLGQTFDGYWKWTDELFVALGLDIGKVIARLGNDRNTPSDNLATAVVLAFLEAKLADRKDEWDMLAGKAYQWLGAAMSDEQAVGYVSMVRSIIADL